MPEMIGFCLKLGFNVQGDSVGEDGGSGVAGGERQDGAGSAGEGAAQRDGEPGEGHLR